MHLRSISSMIFLSFSVMIPASLMWVRVGNLFFTFQLIMSPAIIVMLYLTCTHVSLSVCIRATTRYRAMVLCILRPLWKDRQVQEQISVGENLSSCPSRQVEMKRQHESGHGMDLYCSRHLQRLKYVALYDFYWVRPANYNAHIKPKNKCNRNQVSKPLAADWDLLKLCLEGKWLRW